MEDTYFKVRKKIRSRMRKLAREKELAGESVPLIMAPRTQVGVIEAVSNLRGHDAQQAAAEIFRDTTDEYLLKLCDDLAKGKITDVEARYLRCCVDMEYFAETYLPNHFSDKITCPITGRKRIFHPDFHCDLANLFMRIAHRDIVTPTIIAGFPECGKTTMCTLMFPIHNILHGAIGEDADGNQIDLTKRFHMYVSAVEPNARILLNGILEELETNERIIADYGHLYQDPTTGRKGAREWSVGKATTTNGVHLIARGRRGKFRTLKWRQYRPDLGIGDDIETDEGVKSRSEREKMERFFFNTFIPRFAKGRGNVILLGNILDEASLMSNLVKQGKERGWETRVYRLYEKDENTGEKKYLMPEFYGAAYEQEKMNQLMGDQVVFRQEFLQDPTANESELALRDFVQYSDEEFNAAVLNSYKYITADPAATRKKSADYTAVGGVAYNPDTHTMYVLPNCIESKLNIGEQISTMVHIYLREQPYAFGVESVGYQKVLKPLLEDYCVDHGFLIEVREVKTENRHKFARIRRLFPAIRAGKIKFNFRYAEHRTMADQLIALSRGVEPDYDDLADMLEMAVRMCDEDGIAEYMGSGCDGTIGMREQGSSVKLETFKNIQKELDQTSDEPRTMREKMNSDVDKLTTPAILIVNSENDVVEAPRSLRDKLNEEEINTIGRLMSPE